MIIIIFLDLLKINKKTSTFCVKDWSSNAEKLTDWLPRMDPPWWIHLDRFEIQWTLKYASSLIEPDCGLSKSLTFKKLCSQVDTFTWIRSGLRPIGFPNIIKNKLKFMTFDSFGLWTAKGELYRTYEVHSMNPRNMNIVFYETISLNDFDFCSKRESPVNFPKSFRPIGPIRKNRFFFRFKILEDL